MTNLRWLVYGTSVILKAALVYFNDDYTRGLMNAGLTVFVDLVPVMASSKVDRWNPSVRTLDTFGRQGSSLISLGALMMLGALCLGNFVALAVNESLISDSSRIAGIELRSFHVPGIPALSTGDILLFMFVAPITFVIGKWMGRGLTPSVPMAQGAGNVLAAYMFGMAMPMVVILAYAVPTDPMVDGQQLLVSALILLLLLVVLLYGYQRGHKQVLGAYITHLLARLPVNDRDEILKRAYSAAVAHQGARANQSTIITLFGA